MLAFTANIRPVRSWFSLFRQHRSLFCVLLFLLAAPAAATTLQLLQNIPLAVPEPSGLTLDRETGNLYVVSDPPHNRVYKLDAAGNLLSVLAYTGNDLEGISFDRRDRTLWVVEERRRELVHLDTTGLELARAALDFPGEPNSGFEGVALNPETGSFLVLNEKEPGAFLLVDSSFSIQSINYPQFAEDYSGAALVLPWNRWFIISAESELLGLWDPELGLVDQWDLDMDQAEGVDFDLDANRLYVVDDAQELLRIFLLPDLPEAPANLTLRITGTQVVLHWDAPPGSAGFRVLSSDHPSAFFATDYSGAFTDTSWSAPRPSGRRFYWVLGSSE